MRMMTTLMLNLQMLSSAWIKAGSKQCNREAKLTKMFTIFIINEHNRITDQIEMPNRIENANSTPMFVGAAAVVVFHTEI